MLRHGVFVVADGALGVGCRCSMCLVRVATVNGYLLEGEHGGEAGRAEGFREAGASVRIHGRHAQAARAVHRHLTNQNTACREQGG